MNTTNPEPIRITYFPIRGRVEALRMMLEELALPYVMESVTLEQWPQRRRETPFDQLPLMEIDGRRIAQSRAMIRYLARKHDLYGENTWQSTQCDILDEAIRDLGEALGRLFWHPRFEQKREAFTNAYLPDTLQHIENYLEASQEHEDFCVGTRLSFVDFTLYNLLDYVRAFSPDTLPRYGRLSHLKSVMERRPRMKAYLHSARRPPTITVAAASFGGTPETS